MTRSRFLKIVLSMLISMQMSFLSFGQLGNEWFDSSQRYFTFKIGQNGVYRLDYNSLSNNGIPVDEINPKNIQIFKNGEEQYLYVYGQEDNSFDIISLSNSLHHLENPKEIFAEMERVLAQYGIIIINEMISDGLSKRQKSHLKLHHFAAEVDRALGGTHNETFKGVRFRMKLVRTKSNSISCIVYYKTQHL